MKPKRRAYSSTASETRVGVILWRRLASCFQRRFPGLVGFLTSAPEERKTLKKALGFPVGVAIGAAFHWTIVDKLKIHYFQVE